MSAEDQAASVASLVGRRASKLLPDVTVADDEATEHEDEPSRQVNMSFCDGMITADASGDGGSYTAVFETPDGQRSGPTSTRKAENRCICAPKCAPCAPKP